MAVIGPLVSGEKTFEAFTLYESVNIKGEFSWNSSVDSMNAVYSKTLLLELRHFTFDINANRTLLSRRVNRVSRWRLVVVKRTTGKQKSEKNSLF